MITKKFTEKSTRRTGHLRECQMGLSNSESVRFFPAISADQIRCITFLGKTWSSCLSMRNKGKEQEFSFGHS